MYDSSSDGSSDQKDLFSELIQHTDDASSLKVKSEKHPLTITINMDKILVFVLTCTIVFAVIFFYGIETGKKITGGDMPKEGEASHLMAVSSQEDIAVYALPEKGPSSSDAQSQKAQSQPAQKTEEVITLEVPEESVAEKKEKKHERILDSAWTVQTITYVNERYAKDEAKKIKERGFDCYILPSGKYLQVCVGQYDTKAEAVKVLEKFKKQKDYTDAYVRNLDKDKLLRIKKFQERR